VSQRRAAALLALGLALALLARGRSAAADDPTSPGARARWQAGVAAYQARDYPAAAREFEASYALEPRRATIFAWAQARRLGGDCEAAVALYRRYLETRPSREGTRAAQEQIARCEQVLATESRPPEPGSAPPSPAAAPAVSPAPPPAPDGALADRLDRAGPAPRALGDPLGLALVGTGVAALGVGGAFFWTSHSAAGDADVATSYERYQELHDRARQHRSIAIAATAVGSALVAGGVIRFLVVRHRAAASIRIAVEPGPAPRLLVSGAF
jgi:hypothetical protein